MEYRSKVLIAIGLALLIITVAIWWALTPSWTSLFSHALSDSAQTGVVELLSKEGVRFKIDDQTKAILIIENQAKDVRKLLADNDLPQQAGSGLEMFNSSDYGLSEFAQNINYQKGMEEELARTILKMEGVRNARIHLTIKKDSLFEERRQDPKASVVIGFKDGFYFDTGKINGIQELLASAIPNLQAKNVVVLTDKGNIVSKSSENEYLASDDMVKAKYELLLRNLLDSVLGVSGYKLAINVQLDNRKKVTVEENYHADPKSGEGFPVKVRSSISASPNPNNRVQDAPQNTLEKEFIYSKERSEISNLSADINKVTVGLVIDEHDIDMISSLTPLINATLAIDAKRGDLVSIVALPLIKSPSFASDSASEYEKASVGTIGEKTISAQVPNARYYWGAAILILLTLIGFFRVLVRAYTPRRLSTADRERIAAELIQWVRQ